MGASLHPPIVRPQHPRRLDHVAQRLADRPYLAEFVRIMRETSLLTLPGVTLL